MNRLKHRLRSFLETAEPTPREKKLLNKIDKLQDRVKELTKLHRDVEHLQDDLARLREKDLAPLFKYKAAFKTDAWYAERIPEIEKTVYRLDRGVRLNGALLERSAIDTFDDSHVRSVLNLFEAQVYSQNGEDGILLHIFKRLGTTNRIFFEIGAGGMENNTNNLFFNHAWRGTWVDIDQGCMDELRTYMERNFPELADNARIVVDKVLRENINDLVKTNCEVEEPDLLTIDVDSNDGHLLRELSVVRPRVIGMEYNSSFGRRNLMVEYNAEFWRGNFHPYYHGASLHALTKIAEETGYSLIGCDSEGINAFYVRNDVLGDHFPALTADQAFIDNKRRTANNSSEQQWELIKDFPMVEA